MRQVYTHFVQGWSEKNGLRIYPSRCDAVAICLPCAGIRCDDDIMRRTAANEPEQDYPLGDACVGSD
jgi:hypothetical protein